MEIICTRPSCTQPLNFLSVDTESEPHAIEQTYCQNCGMELLLADRYLPIELLEQDDFSAAFLASDRDRSNLPLYVVKQFRLPEDDDFKKAEVVKRVFQREGQVLEKLSKKHPQIPDLYDFFSSSVLNAQGKKEQYHYVAEEFIDGQNLQQELEAKGSLGEVETIAVLTTMLEILEIVHDGNTLHRNIKPANIMRDKQGVLYLIDFGWTKELFNSIFIPASCKRIISGITFAAPEQLSGRPCLASDLYSLGVTCINLLTGKPLAELYNSAFDTNTGQWHQCHQFAPNVSDRLKQILDRLLLPSPSQRFQSASQVLEALRELPTENAPINLVKAESTRPPRHKKRRKRPFSRSEIIFGAGFAGFEGSLLYIGLISWLSLSAASLGIFGAMMGGIIFVIYRRIIKKIDLTIVATVTAIIVAFVPKFQGSLNAPTVIVIAISSALIAIAVTAIFRLVYRMLR